MKLAMFWLDLWTRLKMDFEIPLRKVSNQIELDLKAKVRLRKYNQKRLKVCLRRHGIVKLECDSEVFFLFLFPNERMANYVQVQMA